MFSCETLTSLLGAARMERVRFYAQTDSTMLRLQELAAHGEGAHGLVVLAEEQTAGRGRQGRSFASPGGLGVYLSLLILPGSMAAFPSACTSSCDAADSSSNPQDVSAIQSLSAWTTLTSRLAVAMCRAVETVCGMRPGIKWVNDLWMGGKKVGGILVQADPAGDGKTIRQIRVGIGINVLERPEDFPEELREVATSLYSETGKKISREELAAAMIRELDALLARWPEGQEEDLAAYQKNSVLLGRSVSVIHGTQQQSADAIAIRDDFSLLVRYADGREEILRGGEISIRT